VLNWPHRATKKSIIFPSKDTKVHSCCKYVMAAALQEAPLYRRIYNYLSFSQLIRHKKLDGLGTGDVTWNNIYIQGSLFIPPNVCGVTKKLIENWWGNFSYFQAPDRKHWNTDEITSKWKPTERNLHIYLVLSRCAALLQMSFRYIFERSERLPAGLGTHPRRLRVDLTLFQNISLVLIKTSNRYHVAVSNPSIQCQSGVEI
jgi:hypothetical protein